MDDVAIIALPMRVAEALGLVRSRHGADGGAVDGWDRKRIDAAVARLSARVRATGRMPTPAGVCRATLAEQAVIKGCHANDPDIADFALAMKLGYAAATGTLAGVAPHEASLVLHCGDFDDAPAAMPPPEPVPVPSAGGPVRFAYVSMEAVRGRRNPQPVAREGHVALVPVHGDEAPVVARLLVPPDGRDEAGEVALRRHGDHWLRPVLAPGCWKPLDGDGFRRACASGEAWVDDPFAPPAGDAARLGVGDVAPPPGAGQPEGPTAKVAAQADAALQACLRRAGTLFLVDGVVHRVTGEPGLHVEVAGTDHRQVRVRDPVVRVGWHLEGDISSSTDQATYGRRIVPGLDDMMVGMVGRGGRIVSLPLDAGELAATVATAIAGNAGGGRALARATADVTARVDVVDQGALPAWGEVGKLILLAIDDALPHHAFRQGFRDKRSVQPFAWAAGEAPCDDAVPDAMSAEALNPDMDHVTGVAQAVVAAVAAMARREAALAAEAREALDPMAGVSP